MDGALDGLLCLRSMVTGVDPVTGGALTGTALADSQRVRAGMAEVLLTGTPPPTSAKIAAIPAAADAITTSAGVINVPN